MDSEIIKVSEEVGLSQDDKNCLTRVDSMAVYKRPCIRKENMKFLCYGKKKKIIPKQVQCGNQQVQYAEAMVEERSRLEKEM